MQKKIVNSSKFLFEISFQRTDVPKTNDITCYYKNFKTSKSKTKFCLDYLICFYERLKAFENGRYLFFHEFKSWLKYEYPPLITDGFFIDGVIDLFRKSTEITYSFEYNTKTRYCSIFCLNPSLTTLYLSLIRLTWELMEDKFLTKEDIMSQYLKGFENGEDYVYLEE
ncbi:MAG: hypothetical protein U0V75_12255 [Ferruginibacter sp.]